jgi:hypothetical protein
MILSDKHAVSLAVDLGLVVSVWHEQLEVEVGLAYPSKREGCEPDLRVTPQGETARAVALTDDGRAFLALLADEIPPTVRTPYG